MSDLEYSVQEWTDAYEQAEIADFKDGPDLHDWPLSQFMCGSVESSDTVKRDPRIMQGAINMLESEGFDGWSPEFFTTVLGTANGTTEDDFQELAIEHAQENYSITDPQYPVAEDMNGEGDWETWYRDHAVGSTEVYGNLREGGTLFWFDRGTTW